MKWTKEETIAKCREFEWEGTGKYCSPAFNADGELEYIIFEQTEDAEEFEERYGIPDGVDVTFTDSGEFCGNCGRWIPSEYGSCPDYWVDYESCEITCGHCLRENESWAEDYVESLRNNPESANHLLPDAMLQGMGWHEMEEGFENGWYGIEDDPVKIMKRLNDRGLDVVFNITDINPFATRFSAWTKPSNEEEN